MSRFLIKGPDLLPVVQQALADPEMQLVRVLGSGNTVSEVVVEMPDERRDAVQAELGEAHLVEEDAELEL